MQICIYTETFDGLDQLILKMLDQGHTLTVLSSKTLKLPKSFWFLGLENPDRISGSFFITEKSYIPAVREYPSIRFFCFDLIMRCSNVHDNSPMEQHSIDASIPIYDFKPGDEIDADGFIKNSRKLFEYKHNKDDPLISIVTPIYNTDINFLKECAESVERQIYRKFEWIIIDDGSTEEETKKYIDFIRKDFKENDKCDIFFYEFKENKGIAEAICHGLLLCKGNYIAFLDSDDIIEPECLFEIAKYVKNNPNVYAFYTNQKNINLDGSLIEDVRKPDFHMELFYQCMYINHMKVINREAIISTIGFPDCEYKGSWDWEWFLRIAEEFKIGHLRKFLYRWRRKPKRSLFEDNQTYNQLALKAVRESNHRTRIADDIVASELPFYFNIKRGASLINLERVKILILCKKNPVYLKLLIDSIERESKYLNYSVVITQHIDKEDKDMTEFLNTLDYKVNRCNIDGFNYSEITNWQIQQDFEPDQDKYVMILNDDIIFQNDCIEHMVACMQHFDGCEIVGPKLIWPGRKLDFIGKKYTCYGINSGAVQHSGVDLYSDKCCGHRYYGFPNDSIALNYIREVDAVTFAAVLIKSNLINSIKFDKGFPVDYNDIDFCIRAKQMGANIYYTPWAIALHWESITKEPGSNEDYVYFESKHGKYLKLFPTFAERQDAMLKGL